MENWGDRAQRGGADFLPGGWRACATSQPLLRAGAGWQADITMGKMPTFPERSGGTGVRFIPDPAHPAGSQLSSIAVVVDVLGRDGRVLAFGLLVSCFWKEER